MFLKSAVTFSAVYVLMVCVCVCVKESCYSSVGSQKQYFNVIVNLFTLNDLGVML